MQSWVFQARSKYELIRLLENIQTTYILEDYYRLNDSDPEKRGWDLPGVQEELKNI